MGTKPLRVGVLCDSLYLAAWQAECLKSIRASAEAEIALFVINDDVPQPPRPFAQRLRRNLTNGLLLWRVYERLVVSKAVSTHAVELPAGFDDVPQLRCKPLKVGRFRQAIDAPAIEELRGHELDVLIRFGFGILTGDVLSAAKHGIWSYHHGDPEQFRGAPPAFWEIHNGSPVTGTVLQRLTESLDGGVILRSARFQTIGSSYRRSLDRIFFGAAGFIRSSLAQLRNDPEAFTKIEPLQRPGPIYRYPKNSAMLRFLVKSCGAWVRDHLRSLFRHQQWGIGVIPMPVTSLLEQAMTGQQPSPQWLPERPGRFLADPMISDKDGDVTLLAEEFDWRTGLGHIARVEGLSDSHSPTTEAIRTEHHLSYPQLVEDAGRLYCIPECAESGRVTLYCRDSSNGCWAEKKVLLEHFAGVDPTVFKHNGRWWLFCTSAEDGPNEVLYAWHATDLLGEWQPHANNPIKIDIGNARPAGPPFQHEGFLIRPAQDCSRRYGGGLVFNRILKLSPDDFVEESVARLDPDPQGPFPAGLHTVSGADGITVIDGARYTFILPEMRRTLARKFRLGRRG